MFVNTTGRMLPSSVKFLSDKDVNALVRLTGLSGLSAEYSYSHIVIKTVYVLDVQPQVFQVLFFRHRFRPPSRRLS